MANSKMIIALLLISQISFSQGRVKSEVTIQASSRSLIVPVLKGISTNPVVQVKIYVPVGTTDVEYSGINVALDQSALKNIDKIAVYFNANEPLFNPEIKPETVTPISVTVTIPFKQSLRPGFNYIWLALSLKETASPDDKIFVHAKELVTSSGRRIVIKQENQVVAKRIGIAVKKSGDQGVHTFRIPGITTTDKGTLIAVYDIRYTESRDLPGNIDVGMSRSTNGGKTWEPMQVIMDMGAPHENNGVGDPSILFDPVTKKIWVSALWSKGNRSIAGSQPGLTPDETGQFAVVSSSDDGLTWTVPQSITPQVKNPSWKLFFPGPGNGIAMQDGKIVFPAQYWDGAHMPHSTLVYSADHGISWKSGVGAKSNTTESQLVETKPGTLMLNMRDNRGAYRSIATTTNMGQDWLEHPTSYHALPDPVCMGSLIKAMVNVKGQKKEVLFFSNVNSSTARLDITVKASLDLGETWPPANTLLVDERRTFGYSVLTRIDDHTVGLLYEGVRDLYFIRIPVNEIVK